MTANSDYGMNIALLHLLDVYELRQFCSCMPSFIYWYGVLPFDSPAQQLEQARFCPLKGCSEHCRQLS